MGGRLPLRECFHRCATVLSGGPFGLLFLCLVILSLRFRPGLLLLWGELLQSGPLDMGGRRPFPHQWVVGFRRGFRFEGANS